MAKQEQTRRPTQGDTKDTDQSPDLSERGGVERSAQPERTTEAGEFANERHDRTRDRELNRRQGGIQDVRQGS